jgi:DNA/RNA endonuclease YhcR with UshA esterase domain
LKGAHWLESKDLLIFRLLIFVNVQTGIAMGGLNVGQAVSVTGFSSQYDTHYEIDPRSPADITAAKP